MALDVRIFISIFISVGAQVDGCGVSSGFTTNLLNLPFFARGVPQRAADVHGLPTRPDSSISMPNLGVNSSTPPPSFNLTAFMAVLTAEQREMYLKIHVPDAAQDVSPVPFDDAAALMGEAPPPSTVYVGTNWFNSKPGPATDVEVRVMKTVLAVRLSKEDLDKWVSDAITDAERIGLPFTAWPPFHDYGWCGP